MAKKNRSEDENKMIGSILKIRNTMKDDLKDYQVILGFSGFGNIGYLSLSHIIETAELEAFSFWGANSWFYRDNIESTITAYMHHESKSVIITSRLPIFVSAMTKAFWDRLIEDILAWECRRYIVIAGLREETREAMSTDWAAFIPTKKWTKLYGHTRNFADKLTMIGPLSSILLLGTTMNIPVLGLLAYCNLEDDPDAALFTLKQIEELADINIEMKDKLQLFDFNFLSTGITQNTEIVEEDLDDDEFNIDDLL